MLYNLYTKEQCLTEYEMVEYFKDKTKPFYVYILVEPETYKPVYVGKGSGSRLFYHWYSNLKSDTNKLKQNKLNKINEEYGYVLYFIHSFFKNETLAYKQETSIQKSLGLYIEGGFLYNSKVDCKAGGISKSKKYYSEKCKKVHQDTLTLLKVYKPNICSVNYASMLCNVCNSKFEKRINHLLSGQGCPKCSISKQTLSLNKVIKRFKKVHGNKYDYSKVTYVNVKTEVVITCKKHGDFTQSPEYHFKGCGCPKCSARNRTTEQVIGILKDVMGSNYSFDKAVYLNAKEPLIITCKKHGDFELSYNRITSSGRACPKCKSESSNK